MKILIADDSKDIRKRVKAIVENFSEISNIYEASNGEEAIRVFNEKKPDLIILDIQMPKGNGIEVLKYMSYSQDVKSRVVVLSNHEETQYKNRCLQLGADAYLVKSMEFENLYEVLCDLIEVSNTFLKKTNCTS